MKEKVKKLIPSKRRLIQLYAALLTNANLKGFGSGKIYQGDVKSICAPGLNCYSCPGASAACPLGALQNALASSGARVPYYVFGILLLFGLIFGRWICGFLCPFGLIQDLLHKIRTPKLKKNRVTRVLSYLKFVILAIFVIILPLIYALQKNALALPAFCKYICPSGTLLGAGGLLANENNNDMFSMLGPLFTWKFCLLVVIVVACVFIYRAFCRFLCPLGALYGLFNKISLLGIKLDKPSCNDCGRCIDRCKMDIRHVGDHECISCGDCIGVCKAISRKGPKILLAPNEAGSASKVKNVKQVLPKKTKIARAVVAAVLILVLGLALVYYNVIDRDPVQTQDPTEATGQTVPSVPLTVGDLCFDYPMQMIGSGETFSLEQTRGKVTVLNFWGKWCGPCVAELLNEFPRIAEEYHDSVVVVTIHSAYDSEGAADYIEENFADFHYSFCQDGNGDEFYKMLGGGDSWPATVILDEDGIIVSMIPRATTYDELKQAIDSILAN